MAHRNGICRSIWYGDSIKASKPSTTGDPSPPCSRRDGDGLNPSRGIRLTIPTVLGLRGTRQNTSYRWRASTISSWVPATLPKALTGTDEGRMANARFMDGLVTILIPLLGSSDVVGL